MLKIEINLDTAIFRWQAEHNERMTYAELARRAGIPALSLYRLKAGPTYPDLRKVAAICEVLECTPGDIFVLSEEKK